MNINTNTVAYEYNEYAYNRDKHHSVHINRTNTHT